MRSKLLKALILAAYAGALVVLFVVSAYTSFNLFVRSGVTRTPDLTGLGSEDSRALLAAQGLGWTEEEGGGRYSESVPLGNVVQQFPRAGSLVKRGSEVEVVLSLGPERLTVPDLKGHALQAAQVALAASGLLLGRTVAVYGREAGPGTVVEQHPAPGAPVAPETPVDLLVALAAAGQTYLMPDLVYRQYEEVRRFFVLRGMAMGNVRFEPYEGVAAGVILRQFPLPGHPLSRRDAVSLVVASPDGTPR